LGIGVEEFIFEVRKVGIIQRELPLQGTITHSSSTVEDGDRLLEYLFKGHCRPSLSME
jgi:hypothetical protein